jgi:hypothetical protein
MYSTKLISISILIVFGCINLYAQNVGINNSDPKAKLDISGDLILKSADLTLADGNTLALDINTNKYNHYKLLGPTGNFQIGGIAAGEHDRIITLYNRTGHSLEVYNDDINADVANRILTGTGGTFAVYSGGSVTLKYDNTINKWEITASHYNSLDNFGSGNWSLSGDDIYNANIGNVGVGTNTPLSKLSINGELALMSDTIMVNCATSMNFNLNIDNNLKRKSVIHLIENPSCYPISPNLKTISGGNDGEIIHLITHLNYTTIHHLGNPNGPIPFTPATQQDSLNMIELYEPNSSGNNSSIITLKAGSTISFIYDGKRNKWKPISFYGEEKPDYAIWYKGANPNHMYSGTDRVGIGTGIPSQKLDVSGNARVRDSLIVNGNALFNNNLITQGNVGIGNPNPIDKLHIVDNNLTSGSIRIGANTADGSPKLLKFGDGNFVTIGENYEDDFMELKASKFFFNKTNNTPIVSIGSTNSSASLSALRGLGTDGTAAFFGTTHSSHFNYNVNEDTYIRGGKNGSKIFLNDHGGQIGIGTTSTGTAQLQLLSSRTGLNASGLSINQNTTNNGNNSYGLITYSNGSDETNFGLKSEVGGSGTGNAAGQFIAQTNSSGGNVGVESNASGSSFVNRGGQFTAAGGNISTVNMGVLALADGNGGYHAVYGNISLGVTPSPNYFRTAIRGEALPFFPNNYAGYFAGNTTVTGGILACDIITKSSGSFMIDHPLDPSNKYLYHSFVESPDMLNIYNDNIVTDENGIAIVSLPEYFDSLNKDFKYQLTVIGQFANAIIFKKISNNQFTIKTDMPNVEVSWQVTGIRKDVWANANRIIPEVEKEQQNKGKYISPLLFGKNLEDGIRYSEPLKFKK